MSAGGSVRAIVAALLANAGIAIAKFIGFLITGSSSILAESMHSVADTTNQALLLLGTRTSRRKPTEEHPFGYGRDRYFYSFIVALLLFTLGAVVAIYEGVDKLRHPHELNSPIVAVAILLVAIVLETFSFRTAIVESGRVKGGVSWWGFIRQAKIPELPVVLLEDAGALLGLVFALFGVGLTMITGDPIWDAVGTLAIGLLLAAIATFLIVETKSLLIGEGANPGVLRTIVSELERGEVRRVIHIRTQYLGPEELLVAAKIALNSALSTPDIARAIDEAEARIRAMVPEARLIYLEPDLDRSTITPGSKP